MAKKQETQEEGTANTVQEPQAELGYPDEEEEGLYGWKFHKGPLLAAVILTVVFYIFVFLWVD